MQDAQDVLYGYFAHSCIKKLFIVYLKFNFDWARHNIGVCECTQGNSKLQSKAFTKSFKCHVLC